MNYDTLLELIQKRRSIRSFKPEPIPDEYVDKIIEAARWAPSGANSQPWEFIVVKKQEVKDSITQLVKEELALYYRMELIREPGRRFPSFTKPAEQPPGFATAPIFIILCGDLRTKDTYPMNACLQGGQLIFNSSLANAYLYMHLAATTLGLASQWVTAIAYPTTQPLVKHLLGMPKELEIYDMMAVGYPASEPRPRLVRDRAEMVHHDHYDKTKFRTEREIQDFIAALYRPAK